MQRNSLSKILLIFIILILVFLNTGNIYAKKSYKDYIKNTKDYIVKKINPKITRYVDLIKKTTDEVVTEYEGIVTMKCSDFPGQTSITLEVNGISETISCDTNPPTGIVSYSPDIWTNGNVIVSVECSDDNVGCEQDIYTKEVFKNESGEIIISDKGGNTEIISYTVDIIDKIDPVLDVGNKNYSWQKENIKIQLLTSDSLSGLKYSKYIWNNSTGCESSGTSFINNEIIELNSEGKHTLYLCNSDLAGNIKSTNFGTYKIDKSAPETSVLNKDINGNIINYDWINKDIIIQFKIIDEGSGIDYSKYIWNDESLCLSDGIDFINSQRISLTKEGEHNLYLCFGDNIGNIGTKKYGTYKLDKTEPTMDLSIPDSKLAGDSNFNITYKLFDNINGEINQESYDKYELEYTYSIQIDGDNIVSSNKILSNIEKTDIFSITDASEKDEKFKIIFTLTDKAGNMIELEKEFVIYPGNLNKNKTELISSSNGDKFANNKDFYSYILKLKDEYGNSIYNKKADISINNGIWSKTIHTDIFDGNSSHAISIFDNINNISDNEGNIYFKIKSLAPGEFSQDFDIVIEKWGDNYISNSDDILNKIIQAPGNLFKKPVIGKLNIVEGGNLSELGKQQKYSINLTNIGNIINYSYGKLNISESTIIQKIGGHFWNNFNLINNNFSNNIGTDLLFSGSIDADYNILELPNIGTTDLVISYKLLNEDIKYYLDNFGIEQLESCDVDTLGLKVIGTLQGDGKSDITGQEENISDISKGELRSVIRKNTYLLIKNRINDTIVNGVKYVEGDFTVSGENLGYETLIVKNGNVIINDNLNVGGKKLGIIVLKDNYLVQSDYDKVGNIYVNNNVTNINALIYADGTFRSAKSNGDKYFDIELDNKLELNGSLFTRNTIGGAVKANSLYVLPGGETTNDYELAEIYDLNYIRKSEYICGNDDNYSFVIKYNPKAQLDPPKGFGE